MADRFDKFTRSARNVLVIASEEAHNLGHKSVQPAHILVAAAVESWGIAGKSLSRMGVTAGAARKATRVTLGVGTKNHPPALQLSLDKHAKRVIERSVDEARARGEQNHLSSHDLLLGVMREPDSATLKVMASLEISADQVRTAVAQTASEMGPETVDVRVIDGKAIAAEVRAEVAERAKALHAKGVTPGLALVLVGDDPSSLSYVRSKGTTAEEAGIFSELVHLPESTPEADVIAKVRELNADERFHGILVQLPLPKQVDENRTIAAIDPVKDVDGVTATSLGRLMRGEPCPWPATPAGIVELLHRSGHPPAGKHVVVCGRSNIVGKPVANILMQKSDRANATVTLCHTGTQDLTSFTRQADILIAAMGVAGAITADMVKPGAVVIDVGNNWVEDATRKSGRRLVGDVDYEAVREVAGAITPVPGGVGPMTIAMLLSNTVWLAERSATD